MNKFPQFHSYTCEGDSVTVERGDFTLTAIIMRDDCSGSPAQRDEGFWPSLDKSSAGYIGPKSVRTLARCTAHATAVLDAWNNDEWFYCGVCVQVLRNGIAVTGNYDNAVWGVECNYPTMNGSPDNSYLSTVANELIDDAISSAKSVVAGLVSANFGEV